MLIKVFEFHIWKEIGPLNFKLFAILQASEYTYTVQIQIMIVHKVNDVAHEPLVSGSEYKSNNMALPM